MYRRVRHTLVVAIAIAAVASPAAAQAPTGLMADLIQDVKSVQAKLVSLAKATPADKQTWRPGEGVRSTSEVFMHVAADNYFLPHVFGVEPHATSGIVPTDMATLTAFETKTTVPDSIAAELDRSFAHLVAAMSDSSHARLEETVKFFGQDMTVRQVWLITTMHLHEHLGQAIAYARTNGIVPPWSRQSGS
jgi:uncharacterized damage-inducible protein DinB